MPTVLEIISDAMQDAGILAAGEAPDAAEGQKAFRLLNRMLDTASTDNLMIYSESEEVFSLTSSKKEYTIGSGGDFNTSRPIKITKAYARDTNGNDYPINIISYQEYADISSKSISTSLPLSLYYDDEFPLGKITLWPTPSAATYDLVLWSLKPITSFTSLSDSVSLPPAYEEYIETNLAARCCVAFGQTVPADLREWAAETKASIRRANLSVPTLTMSANSANGGTFPIPRAVLTGF